MWLFSKLVCILYASWYLRDLRNPPNTFVYSLDYRIFVHLGGKKKNQLWRHSNFLWQSVDAMHQ